MGYTTNVALSIPMAIIIYMLTEKLIISTVSEKQFDEKVQSNFIIGFITGLVFIALAMTAFADRGAFDNQSLQLALYGAGGFMVLNSVFFSWDVLDEKTKMMILAISVTGMVLWSYTQKTFKSSKKNSKKKQLQNQNPNKK